MVLDASVVGASALSAVLATSVVLASAGSVVFDGSVVDASAVSVVLAVSETSVATAAFVVDASAVASVVLDPSVVEPPADASDTLASVVDTIADLASIEIGVDLWSPEPSDSGASGFCADFDAVGAEPDPALSATFRARPDFSSVELEVPRAGTRGM